MAIYHMNMRSIGRKTHEAGTAGAHIRYITRPDAEPLILSQHMPQERWQARAWMDREELADRANARVCDKLNIALPRELNTTERLKVVQDFCQKITQDRCPFYAVIHQEEGNDRENPHAHIMLRDRDITPGKNFGKRVMCLSDNAEDRTKKGFEHPRAMDQVRELWADVCNEHLERAGFEERIDHRTLKAQQIDREPQIHVGAWSNRQAANDLERPDSQVKLVTAWGQTREIRYPDLDQGKTRLEHNAEIIDLEQRREKKRQQQLAKPAPQLLVADARAKAWAEGLHERQRKRQQAKLEAQLVITDARTKEELERVQRQKAILIKDQWEEQRRVEALKGRARWKREDEQRVKDAEARAVEIRAALAEGQAAAERAEQQAAQQKAQLDAAHREALRANERRLRPPPNQGKDIPTGVIPLVRDDFEEKAKQTEASKKAEQEDFSKRLEKARQDFFGAGRDPGRTRGSPKGKG